jgi:hypothetical protein
MTPNKTPNGKEGRMDGKKEFAEAKEFADCASVYIAGLYICDFHADREIGLSAMCRANQFSYMINAAHKKALEDFREMAAKALEIKTAEILLACGEMSKQELRTVKAILSNRAAAIRALEVEE